MAGYDLGTARGTIEIDYKGDGISKAREGLDGLKKGAEGSSQSLDKAGTTAGVAGGAIAAGLALAVNSAATFEQRLSAIKAVSGSTADEMEKIRAKALQVGKDTAFSATEAAIAMEELSKSGISTTDILNGAADATVALAAAGEVSLPTAATIAGNAMNQFKLSASDMPRIADLIAGAANASAIGVEDFGQSLNYVGPVAKAVGVSIDDTAAAIAILGNQGIKGSAAGTALRSMLSNLTPTTKVATKQFEALGLITADGTNKFVDAQGRIKPLNEVVQILNDSMKGLSDTEKNTFAKKAFGLETMTAVNILAGQTSESFNEMSASINKVKAADVAATRLDNFKGSMEALSGSVETLAINIGSILLPMIRTFVDGLSWLVDMFISLPQPIQQGAVFIAVLAAGLLLAFAAFVKVKQAIDAMRAAFVVMRTVMAASFLTNPVFLVIAAIVALIAAIVLAYKNSETFRNIVNGAWNAVKTVISTVVTWITGTAWPAIKSAWDNIANAAQVVWTKTSEVFNTVKTFIESVFNGISTFLNTVWTTISNFISAGLNTLAGIWNSVWGTFGPLITAVWNLILAIIQLVFVTIVTFIKAQLVIIQAFWSTIWNAIKTVTTTIWNGIKTAISAVIEFLKPYITTAMNAISTTISTVWNAIKTAVTTVANAIKTVLTTAWNAIKTVTTTVWNAINTVIGDRIRAALTTISGIVSRIRGVFSGASSWLINAGKDIIKGLINGVTSMIGTFTDKIKSLTNMIPKLKGPPAKDKILLEQNGVLIMTGLIRGVTKMIEPFYDTLRGITSDIPGQIAVNGLQSSINRSPSIASSLIPQQRTPDGVTYNTTIVNPLPEPAGESVNKRLQTLTMMGA